MSYWGGRACFGPRTPISQVLPRIYLGDREDATTEATLQKHKIGFVISLLSEDLTKDELKIYQRNRIKRLYIEIVDSRTARISSHFKRVLHHMEMYISAKNNHNRNILVHCHAGISRSATIVIAYVMNHCGLPAESAERNVRLFRDIINPNPGFCIQLLKFEQELLKQKRSLDDEKE